MSLAVRSADSEHPLAEMFSLSPQCFFTAPSMPGTLGKCLEKKMRHGI